MLAPLTMPQTVTLPVFGSANAQAQASGDGNGDSEWQMDSSSDPMDFDLLAEYLLEDSENNAPGLNFDFQTNAENSSTVVSPEQSIDGVQLHENGAAEAQQIIAQHAAGIQHQHQVHPPQQPRSHVAVAPHSHRTLLAPAPTAIAASPMHMATQRPLLAPQGIPLPSVQYAGAATHIAPAPAPIAASGGVNTGIVQHAAVAVTKRRRVDVPITTTMNGVVAPATGNADPMAVAAALQGRGRKKTQAQIDRRRERNRILARRTRLRKKFFFESLQKEVIDLQRENAALKDIVRAELAEDGQKLLDECNANEKLPEAVIEACGENLSEYDQQDFNLVRSIQQSQHSFIITDPSLQDNPIVFASDDFLNITGYAREEVLGRNCRFLQGTDTSQAKVDQIRKGLASGDDINVTLVNYTADGTPFWNKLFIAALRDAQDNIVNFIGVVVKVAGPEPGDPEHGKQLSGGDDSSDGGEASS